MLDGRSDNSTRLLQPDRSRSLRHGSREMPEGLITHKYHMGCLHLSTFNCQDLTSLKVVEIEVLTTTQIQRNKIGTRLVQNRPTDGGIISILVPPKSRVTKLSMFDWISGNW
ncbi:hypothetical protein M8C21_028226 [Ambrosia artemisiifolia]|uniref:Uncharacterized protein n=1 Tax=Ambrosia artemisiifolia TaxID=4212 RepID=A0AAD5GQS6_AMBAR|nr:hypothetical protein M8C21_028226 [Ambrosia artemisiifolia]